jgi:hypothetical protein
LVRTVQDTVAVGKVRLLDQRLMDPADAHHPRHQVVGGQQRVVLGAGEVVMPVMQMIFGHTKHHLPLQLKMFELSSVRLGLSLAS